MRCAINSRRRFLFIIVFIKMQVASDRNDLCAYRNEFEKIHDRKMVSFFIRIFSVYFLVNILSFVSR